MIEKIINGISKAVYDAFGNEYEIYTESMEQGLKEPCFSILCLNPSSERFLNNRFSYTVPIVVNYFPKTREKRIECANVYEKLFDVLEVLQVEHDYMRGVDIHSEYADGVMHAFVTYHYFAMRTQQTDSMETIKQESRVV